MSQTNKTSSDAHKVRWLLAHKEIWERHPGCCVQEETQEHRDIRRRIVRAMQAEGLVSTTTYWKDISLGKLIQVARVKEEEQ